MLKTCLFAETKPFQDLSTRLRNMRFRSNSMAAWTNVWCQRLNPFSHRQGRTQLSRLRQCQVTLHSLSQSSRVQINSDMPNLRVQCTRVDPTRRRVKKQPFVLRKSNWTSEARKAAGQHGLLMSPFIQVTSVVSSPKYHVGYWALLMRRCCSQITCTSITCLQWHRQDTLMAVFSAWQWHQQTQLSFFHKWWGIPFHIEQSFYFCPLPDETAKLPKASLPCENQEHL